MAPMNTRKLQIVTMQKNLWIMFKLNYNFVHDVLNKIVLDLNLLQENCRFLNDTDWRRYEKIARD